MSLYKIFINGKLFNATTSYDYAMNRALGIAMYLGMEFINTKSATITDKWVSDGNQIIITKN